MASKSNTVAGLNFGSEFFSELFKQLKKFGIAEEQIYVLLKTGSPLIVKIVELVVSAVESAEKFNAKLFFQTKNFWFGDNFQKWILPKISKTVPVFQGKTAHFDLPTGMNDREIQKNLTNKNPFSVDEFVSVIQNKILKQPNGEDGELLNNGRANIFYVDLGDGTVVAVNVLWFSDGRTWDFRAHDLDDDRWSAGFRAFSCG